MKTLLLLIICVGLHAQTFFDLSAKDLEGKEIKFSEFKGKVVLVVNTATGCGFASQYNGLQENYKKYKDSGFIVLGFPSNDFKQQEPLKNEEIKKFCKIKYDVDFIQFEKNPVTGAGKQPVFKFLTESNPDTNGEIDWNFEKFLIGKDGTIKARFGSWTGPTNSKLLETIEDLLAKNA